MHRIVYQDAVGVSVRPTGTQISALPLPESLRQGLIHFFGADAGLSPPQEQAIVQGVLEKLGHFLVSAPTNSGKTLIALLRVMLQAIDGGKRSVYVVPLKALAEEKAEEMRRLSEHVVAAGGPSVRIQVSTGDYQLSADFLGSPPPTVGEVLICTPERLDVILRNPENHEWAKSVATYVLDEFHLLGEKGRGAVVESLVTRLLLYWPESTILALSATIGGLEDICGWLGHLDKPVELIESDYRFPLLHRVILESEDKDEFVQEKAAEVLADPGRSLLIFVYKKSDAKKLAEKLTLRFGDASTVDYFHAGRTLYERQEVARRFRDGEIRVLIATTSLKMGINTPASDVIVRDTVFHGSGRVSTADVLQMIGRAGRGNTPGTGYILCTDSEGVAHYPTDFENGIVEPLQPQLLSQFKTESYRKSGKETEAPDQLKATVLSEVARRRQTTVAELQVFIEHSYSGWRQELVSLDVSRELNYLEHAKLVYPVENAESTYAATRLGRTTVLSGLSPESGAMLGGFLRALINLGQKAPEDEDSDKNLLRRLRDLDFLFLAVAAFESRSQLLPKPSKRDREVVDAYIEELPTEEKPLINLWRNSDSPEYPTRRLLSSLKFSVADDKANPEAIFYRLLETAVLLHRHARGTGLDTLASEYKVHAGSLESGLKFTATWVLSCLAQICSKDKCYRLDYLAMRIYELLEDLSLGSTLGKLMTIKGVGRSSVNKLLDAGYRDTQALGDVSEQVIIQAGVARKQAASIVRYLWRQLR